MNTNECDFFDFCVYLFSYLKHIYSHAIFESNFTLSQSNDDTSNASQKLTQPSHVFGLKDFANRTTRQAL